MQTAAVLRAAFRAADHIVRWGGEEFLVVARFVDRRDAPALAEKIRTALAAHDFRLGDGTTLKRTCSIGFAAYPFAPHQPRAIPWETVVDVADLGLYAAKRGGRNAWVGLEAGDAMDPEKALQRFREDPAAAEAEGAVRVRRAN